LITSKKGDYLAQKIFDILLILTSKDLLNLSDADLKAKLSGMAGDGAFCKENKPFKDKMRILFGENCKFRWDILHLCNRAHLDALDSHLEIKELMDFIQTPSSIMRSGLDYTSLFIVHLRHCRFQKT